MGFTKITHNAVALGRRLGNTGNSWIQSRASNQTHWEQWKETNAETRDAWEAAKVELEQVRRRVDDLEASLKEGTKAEQKAHEALSDVNFKIWIGSVLHPVLTQIIAAHNNEQLRHKLPLVSCTLPELRTKVNIETRVAAENMPVFAHVLTWRTCETFGLKYNPHFRRLCRQNSLSGNAGTHAAAVDHTCDILDIPILAKKKKKKKPVAKKSQHTKHSPPRPGRMLSPAMQGATSQAWAGGQPFPLVLMPTVAAAAPHAHAHAHAHAQVGNTQGSSVLASATTAAAQAGASGGNTSDEDKKMPPQPGP